ncbi:NB-ARC domain-containing protein [Spirillospora sp. NPDC047279]|uniref:ATP-binding protein n=1 Tax=Spirillospora sp. NPDC047279 TaxID=3155478 RepID=UPI0033C04F61
MADAEISFSGNLPAEPSRLVGRRRELAQIRRLLIRSRLVTLTGVGGVGKSRLALRVAHDLAPRFRDGAWLVELGALQDGAMVPHAVADAFGRPHDRAARPQLDNLAAFLAERRLLLVLDGCEHVLEAAERLAARLMGSALGLSVLATSRQEPALLKGERMVVEPLPVPPCTAETDRLLRNESVALFVDRARDFELTPGNAVAVAQVCRRLDGIPLAIELAAVRMREMPVEWLLTRLDDRFTVLGRAGEPGRPGGHDRHRTLRTTIGWSHELCTPGERLLWARSSVFRGTFDRAAAEAVCGGDGTATGPLLDGLVAKSIVLPERGRFRLLDTLREYGAWWLRELGEEPALRRRHRDHYLALAERCAREWCGPAQLDWFRRLDEEYTELQAALDFCVTEPGEAAAGQALAGALWPLWIARGLAGVGRRHLERLLPLAPEPSAARTRAWWVLGWVLGVQGETAAALETLELAGLSAVARGQRADLARAAGLSGLVTMLAGDAERGAEMLRESLRSQDGGSGPGDIFPLLFKGSLGTAYGALGRHDAAIDTLSSVRAACVGRGELWWRSHVDHGLALERLSTGAVGAAAEHARAALAVKRDFRDLVGIALCVDILAATAAAAGQAGRAGLLHGAGERIWERHGVPRFGAPMFVTIHEESVRRARAVLGDEGYRRTVAEGAELSLGSAIGYALDHESVPPAP